MFYGWMSNLDGSRLPDFNHIIVRSNVTSDGKYMNSLIIETRKLFGLILWTTVLGMISTHFALKLFIPLGLWFPILISIIWTLGPAVGTLAAYWFSWRNYPKEK